ncbi:MAG: nitroreductase family protein [Nanoarchaeota archaeon]
MDFQKLLEKSMSVKNYSSKKPPIEKIIEAVNAANSAPSAANLPSLIYIIIETPEKIAKIADACQQQFINKAPYVIVVCSNLIQLKRFDDVRAENYLKHNVGAAVENFLLKITDLGLASCWIGAFSESTIKNLLKIPGSINIEVVLPVGYEMVKGKTKKRFRQLLVNRVFFDSWGNKYYKSFVKIRRADI